MSNKQPSQWKLKPSIIFRYLLLTPLYLLFHLLRFFSRVIPRKKNRWVFWHRNSKGFADNSKYYFLHANHNLKSYNIEAVWLTESTEVLTGLRAAGYQAELFSSWRSYWLELTAKFHFCDGADDNFVPRHYWLSNGAVRFNLWHGIPLKKIGYDEPRVTRTRQRSSVVMRLAMSLLVPWTKRWLGDYTIALSEDTKKIFSSAHNIPYDQTVITGYPRDDIFFKKLEGVETLSDISIFGKIREFRQATDKGKVALYAPTWRETKSSSAKGAGINFDKLNQFLQKSNALFLLKYHPKDELTLDESKSYSNLISVPKGSDLNHLLTEVDILVTDYSSAYFDFLLRDLPMIFFCYDLDEYLSKERDLYFDYREFTPGAKAFNFQQLVDSLDELFQGHDKYSEQRKKILKKVYQHLDGNSSQRLSSYIFNRLY